MLTKGFAQFSPFQGDTMDSLIGLSQSLAAQVEKITRLQFDAGLEASREAVTATQALLAVKDPEGLAEWQQAYFQPSLERAAESARQQYDVLVETRGILADALKQSTADATRQVRENIDRLAEGAPDNFAPLFEVIRKSLDTQVGALETMSQVTDQFSEIAGVNLLALKGTVQPAAKSRGVAKRKAA